MRKSTHLHLSWLDKQAIRFEEARFALMTILMTAQSCLGSIAAMFALEQDNTVLLALSAAVTMGSNSAFIAQAPGKWCLVIFYLSVLVNLSVLLLLWV